MSDYGNNNEQVVHMVLDTETTGFKADDGDRIVEIGVVEMINNQPTGRKLQLYIKPIDDNGNQKSVGDSFKVHGLSDEFLADKPLMSSVIDKFIDFVRGTVLVIHNAKFDVKFLEKELELCEKPKLFNLVKNVHCTLMTDTRLFPKEKHKLDDLCDRFGVDRTNRTVHGALLDAELLSECFRLTNLQFDSTKIEGIIEQTDWERPEIKRFDGVSLRKATINSDEELIHQKFVTKMDEKNKKPSIFTLATSKPAKLGM